MGNSTSKYLSFSSQNISEGADGTFKQELRLTASQFFR